MNKENINLFNGDCLEIMGRLIQEGTKFDMIITSPPYDSLRKYEGTLVWNEDIWKQVIKKCFDLLSEGGVMVWIVNDATIKGSETGTSFKQALYGMEVGFNLHDTMIWKKTNPFNMGSNNCYIQCFEYMFIFSKGTPKTLNFIKDRENKTYKEGKKNKQQRRTRNGDFMEYDDKEWEMKEYGKRYNVWDESGSTKVGNHTATFPLRLAKDHIKSWAGKK